MIGLWILSVGFAVIALFIAGIEIRAALARVPLCTHPYGFERTNPRDPATCPQCGDIRTLT